MNPLFSRAVTSRPLVSGSSARRQRTKRPTSTVAKAALANVEWLESRRMLAIADGYYTLMASNGKYVVPNPDRLPVPGSAAVSGSVQASASAPSKQATFYISTAPGTNASSIKTDQTWNIGLIRGPTYLAALSAPTDTLRWVGLPPNTNPGSRPAFTIRELGDNRIALQSSRGYLSTAGGPPNSGVISTTASKIGPAETFVLRPSAFAPVARTITVVDITNLQPTNAPATISGSLAIAVPLSALNAAPIQAPNTAVVLSGGGVLNQTEAVNSLSLSIPVDVSLLGLTEQQVPSTLQLSGNAKVDAPSGVSVDGRLGMSAGTTTTATTPVFVNAKGKLLGCGGILGSLTVEATGEVSPAGSADGTPAYGRLSVGRLKLASDSVLRMQVTGPRSGTDHDQLVVSESASIDGARLVLDATYAPAVGSEVVLLDNRGSARVTGTFRDASGNPLPEGTVVARNLAGSGTAVVISYVGGDGNDVTLKSVALPAAPGRPEVGAATAGPGSVRLTWTAPATTGGAAITDYTVQYSSNNGTSWTTFADGTNRQPGAVVTGLARGASYVFRVSASSAIGQGAFSPTSLAFTGLTTVPTAPRNLQAFSGSRQVRLEWTAPASDGGAAITDYVIEYRRINSASSSWIMWNDGVSTNANALVTGLPPMMPFMFRVSARNAVGIGSVVMVNMTAKL